MSRSFAANQSVSDVMKAHPQDNSTDIWLDVFPRPAVDGHKYHRGHVGIFGAPELNGATRLAASACNRIGVGLVTVVADNNADIYRTTLPPDIMVRSTLPETVTVVLGGSGGVEGEMLNQLHNLSGLRARVFDADALQAQSTAQNFDENCVLTPHIGEFERMFGSAGVDLVDAAIKAAAMSGAILVLKSSNTIIAHPNGRTVSGTPTSPYLAKAGTGDVLAGLIAGLLAQGMPHFEACCAAVWIHGEAGIRLGAGLIANDIPEIIPDILKDIL